ncbi:NAD(+) synthase [Candidatus Saccharibacteria bacterium]|nr:NAD(+) synthase [Candidatus Saccharibacteria bacterium]MCB9821584.1 NAD(+) synthase [Candidatus Nomurabacteria bacterium]
MKKYLPSNSYIRVAAATPVVGLADVETNVKNILELYELAATQEVSIVTFPEMSLTGYTIGDLVSQTQLLEDALNGLKQLMQFTKGSNTAIVVGLPIMIGNALYNAAAVLARGNLTGIVPKVNLPTYKEFYDKRWYQAGPITASEIQLFGETVRFGADQLFELDGVKFGIEICEDVWVPEQRSISLVAGGADLILNPSASPELVTKADYRQTLIANTSGRLSAGYIYAGADQSESTMDIVMSGHAMIFDQARLLAERQPFSQNQHRLICADIDIDHIRHERRLNTNYPDRLLPITKLPLKRFQTNYIQDIAQHVFVPNGDQKEVDKRLEEVFTIQAIGLEQRIIPSGVERVVLGLSGGLDSTLALLVAIRTARLLKKKPQDFICCIGMPGLASSKRTQDNAKMLAEALQTDFKRIPIDKLAKDQLHAIGHNLTSQDITYENTQARMRTSTLFNYANQSKGLVLGTGDLSEIALGWSTFNGDHMSGYNVNASIPKTLVRSLVEYASRAVIADNPDAQSILQDILATPISPELTKSSKDLGQKTEEIVGPYELHDFFLYYFVRWGDSVQKIYFLACMAFEGKYTPSEIKKWLEMFLNRFYKNQWKRSVMPDGPKVGSVSLSPRGDWRMPSDINLSFML